MFTLEVGFDYEGSHVVGVFTSEEEAKLQATKLEHYDNYIITQWVPDNLQPVKSMSCYPPRMEWTLHP